jgi:NAD(P)-dependent dehydrogenase (short-subunit alcohol dehydrogenase family)
MPTVLVTGANRGIGLEFACQYAADGWRVIACCRKPAEAKDLKEVEGNLRVEMLDVGDEGQIAALADRLQGEAIDLLINNAGVSGPSSGTETATWLDVLRVNCIGPLHVAQQLADNVARSKRKTIVSISSGMGSIAKADGGGSYMYRTSKAALNMAMKTLAEDLKGRRVVVVVVNPGWVRTDMGGKGAPLTPGESVGSMRLIFDRLKGSDSGKFLRYDGHVLPW